MSTPLPNRREAPAAIVEWGDTSWRVQFGVVGKPAQVREIFIDLANVADVVDPPVLALIHDAAIVTSHLLRNGTEGVAALARRLTRQHGSLLALALGAAAACERELAQMAEEASGT